TYALATIGLVNKHPRRRCFMQISTLDWIIVVSYFVITLGIGLAFRKRAGRSIAEYFVSGRSFPWWVAGTSMVATTFAVDTPLFVTGVVAKQGLAGNWFWWAFAMGGMLTVFVYARLWRRTGVLTDVELIEIRYGGPAAAFLRGFRSIYVAVLVNSIIIGWVTGAMLKVLKVLVFESSIGTHQDWIIILVLLAAVGIYSTLSGLLGVAVTDVFQFVIAMGSCIVLAVVAVAEVGGVGELQAKVAAKFPAGEQAFDYLPSLSGDNAWMTLDVFLLLLGVQWWATWYPGAEPGGGGYIVQRMASCKDERHSLLATLWFQVAHYCVRPWPWLMIAFVALSQYDLLSLEDPGEGFALVVKDFAPSGLRGLMLVAFFAAFMSTISTQMNWGASYLVNDFYKRFVAPESDEAHLTRVSRIASVFVLCIGAVAAYAMKGVSVDTAWKFLAALGAGTGAVFMLRWFWWRINAWTEISAMIVSLVAFGAVWKFAATYPQSYLGRSEEYRMATVARITIPTWLIITLLTSPESKETLRGFYRLVRPGGPGWRPIANLEPATVPDNNLGVSILAALFGGLLIYLTIPGIGALILGPTWQAIACLAGAGCCAGIIALLLPRVLK
ncbi:MAG: sodium:solute symporter family protein, partial [Aeoliella sp.]